MICLVCSKNEATKDQFLGYIPCQSCLAKQKGWEKPGESHEFTTQEIREARVEHDKSIIQPYREGKVSRKYLEQHGTKGIQVTKKEIKEAMNKPDVWNGMEGRYYDE